MAKQVQLRRGTRAANAVFVGAAGEVSMDTESKDLRLHDGATVGGFRIPTLVAVQYPTEDNGYTWYRKWSDGWVEQGGVYDLGSDVTVANQYAISLPVEMANTNYTGIAVPGGRTTGGQFGSYIVVNDTSNTTTAMFVYVFKTETAYRYINWTVSGMAA